MHAIRVIAPSASRVENDPSIGLPGSRGRSIKRRGVSRFHRFTLIFPPHVYEMTWDVNNTRTPVSIPENGSSIEAP